MKTKQRCLAIILIIAALFTIIQPISAYSMLDEQFNLGYNNSAGKTIFEGFYSDPSIPISFSKLAERALNLKVSGKYSYTSAIQILNETKAILKKTTTADYDQYEKIFNNGVAANNSLAGRFTYDSFIMRNVLYTMHVNNASYTQMLNAIQIVYDCAIIQSQKDAFRCDALDVLRDLNIIASYESDKSTAEMLFYVSKIASGAHGTYNGKTNLPDKNIANNYQKYLDEQADKSHSSGGVIDNTGSDNDNKVSAGVNNGMDYIPDDKPYQDEGYWEQYKDSGIYLEDSFHENLEKLHGGKDLSSLILFYTLDKSNEVPAYYKTRITTRQFVSYENIVTALLTAARNSDLILIEDAEAVLLVHNGSCSVLVQSDKQYDMEAVAELFLGLQDFGLLLGEESEVNVAK